MSASLFSQSWYLVADIKARLRKHVHLHRHIYRDQIWYVLQDTVSGQFHRFTPQAYQIIGMMDGQRTMQTVWEIACETLNEDMPTQDEVISLLSKLFRANVLDFNRQPDIAELHQRQRAIAHKRLLQQLKSPLGIRIPLLDPDTFLSRTAGLVKPLFSRWGAAVWLLTVIAGTLLAAVQWDNLSSNLSDRVLSVSNVVFLMLIYPVVKTIHELGHAYTVKRWGGEVHEIGIMLLIFFPVPYVDASAASAFTGKYQRMLVGAAGVLVEVFIAALAMIIWTLAEPGLVRSMAFNAMMIAGVSTVFFNGNPLLRFDAYYVLADYLEIPNLGSRSNQHIGYLVKRYLFGVENLPAVATGNAEGRWLSFYAVASFAYRMFIMFAIALFIAGEYLFIGVLLAAWSIYSALLAPVMKMLGKPLQDLQLKQKQTRVVLVSTAVMLAVFVLLAVVPFPYTTQVEGVFSAPENSVVRAEIGGFVKSVKVEPGHSVGSGQVLIELNEPGLDAQVEVLHAAVKEARAQYQAHIGDRTEAAINRHILAFRQQEYQQALERQQSLLVNSPAAGVAVIPEAENLPGHYVPRGQTLGYIVDFQQLPVSVMVAEDFIDPVLNRTESIEVRLVSDRNTSYPASIQRVYPATTRELPSEVLSVEGGGTIALDPGSRERLVAFEPYFKIIVEVSAAPERRLNERVYVLFQHPPEPLIQRWFRSARRVLLRQLDV